MPLASLVGCFGVSRCLEHGEIRRITGKQKTQKQKKRKGQDMKSTHLLGGCHVGLIVTMKLGEIGTKPAPINSRIRCGSRLKNCGFRIVQVMRCHSENGILHYKNHP